MITLFDLFLRVEKWGFNTTVSLIEPNGSYVLVPAECLLSLDKKAIGFIFNNIYLEEPFTKSERNLIAEAIQRVNLIGG